MKFRLSLLLVQFAILACCQANEVFERVQKGKPVSDEDLTFTAKIEENGEHVCNGALISNGMVITHNNCVDKKKIEKFKVSFSSAGSKKFDVIRTVTDIKVVGQKNSEFVSLKLDENVLVKDDEIKPITRFSTNELDTKMKSCRAIAFSENGKQLVEVNIALKETSKCRKASSKKNVCFDTKKGSLCQADNGSPIVCQYKGRWYLVGTTLISKGCSEDNIQGTLISYYGNAINKITNDNDDKECGSVPKIKNGQAKLIGKLSNVGSKAKISCELGYKPTKNVITCQKSGSWETSQCEKIGCGSVPKIKNGKVKLIGKLSNVGSKAKISCELGYKPTKNVITCQKSGNWETSQCEKKECGSVPKIKNGKVKLIGKSSNVGSKAKISCKLGYKPTKNLITCQKSGSWETSQCEKKECGSVPKIKDGQAKLIGKSSHVGSKAKISCEVGYKPTKNVITCQQSGSWETSRCDKIDCGAVPKIKNGQTKLGRSTKFGSKADVLCKVGFKPSQNVIKCQKSGRWERSQCVKIDCGSVPVIKNGDVNLTRNSTEFGSKAKVRCERGYSTDKKVILCQSSGKWETSECVNIDCGPPKINGGQANVTGNSTRFGSKATVSCENPKPTKKVIKCQKDGSWEISRCDIDCGPVPKINNGQANVTSNSTGFRSQARVTCKDKTIKPTKKVIKCQEDGSWEISQCEIVDCGIPRIYYGRANMTSRLSTYRSKVDVLCNNGYAPTKKVIKCQWSGIWEQSECVRIRTEDSSYRLPKSVIPVSYDLELQPDIYGRLSFSAVYRFDGSVSIVVECKTDTNTITLHMKGLTIEGDIEVLDSLDNVFSRHEYDSGKQFLRIITNKTLTASNTYTIKLNFSGSINSRYTGGLYWQFDETLRSISLASNLKPIGARTVFPCFDEPLFKSTFNVTLVRKDPMRSLSNMPLLKSEQRDGDWIADSFKTTPMMSTYSLSFVISKFDNYEKTVNSTPVRVFSKGRRIKETQFSLDTVVKVMPFFEDYFQVPYMLPKLDLVASSIVDKENWGLLLLRESYMLLEAENPHYTDMEATALSVANGLVHTWFGSFVTMKWWTEAWLIEGFSTYFKYLGVDFAYPAWNMDDMFIKSVHQEALEMDSRTSYYPLHYPVSTPTQLSTTRIYNKIATNKGAAIVKMLRLLVGDDTFQKGLHNYLVKMQYKAVTREDLWTVMTEQAIADKKNLTNIQWVMDTWVLQRNYPLVTVGFSDEGKISLKQKRYVTNVDGQSYKSTYGFRWNIPFTFATSSTKLFNVTENDITVMKYRLEEVEIIDESIPAPNGSNWVIGNPMLYGFYRVNYDTRNWNALADQLVSDHTTFPVSNRAQLINDAWALFSTKDVGINQTLRTLEFLDKERKWLPWEAASEVFEGIRKRIDKSTLYPMFEKFMQAKTNGIYEELLQNTTDYTHLQYYQKETIIDAACRYGLPACAADARLKFSEWKSTNKYITEKDFNNRAFCSAIKTGSQDDWNHILAKFVTVLQTSLGITCTSDVSNIKLLLEKILAGKIQTFRVTKVMVFLGGNAAYRSLAFEFLTANWEAFIKLFNGVETYVRSIFSQIATQFNTAEDLALLEAFGKNRTDDFKTNPSLQSSYQRAVSVTKTNINWVANNFNSIENWLQKQGF